VSLKLSNCEVTAHLRDDVSHWMSSPDQKTRRNKETVKVEQETIALLTMVGARNNPTGPYIMTEAAEFRDTSVVIEGPFERMLACLHLLPGCSNHRPSAKGAY
jgi:hypothetical protein